MNRVSLTLPKRERCPTNLIITPVDENEIIDIVKHIKTKSSPGYDEIPVDLLKSIISFNKKPVTYIVNNSLKFFFLTN